jgi:hypothetical protein
MTVAEGSLVDWRGHWTAPQPHRIDTGNRAVA